MIVLVDDHHLSETLRTGRGPSGAGEGAEIYTTGYWYVRLCQAVLGSARTSGVLSEPFARLTPSQRERAIAFLIELPPEVGLVSLRELAPVIGRLRARHDLNVLGMEVLAASLVLEAHVFLSAESPRLAAALDAEHRTWSLA